MRLNLGHIIIISALTAGVFFATAPGTATGAAIGAGSPEPGKPLGTLWYPGLYVEPAASGASSVVKPEPAPPIGPSPNLPRGPAAEQTPAPPPAAVPVPPPFGAPATGKPLGTLWYPGAYDPKAAPPQTQPTPVAKPLPAPPIPKRPYVKPLGTLWYPGPYDPKTGTRPAPIPSSGQAPSPVKKGPVKKGPVKKGPVKKAGDVFQPPAPAKEGAAPKQVGGKVDLGLPVHLSADQMSFEQESGLVTATGNVEIIHGQRKLLADKVTYNQNTDVVTASGNVQLTEPGGELIFGDHMKVSGDLKDAIIESIGIILTDKSRIAATGARRSAGLITEMRKGVYSPCNLCQNDPERPPLWQIKAVRIIHDKVSKTIEYRDAWLEVFGVPVAYTPYFSHPDPTVKRKSGFLAPTVGGSSDLGVVTRIPYYLNISPEADATVTALITGEEGSGAIGEYRHRFRKGTLDVLATLVGGDSEDDIRGHIESKGRFDFNRTWRGGFDFNRATDDTYMRRYGLGSPESLNSRLFAEGFRKRNYFAINGFAFQGLRATDDPGQDPLVLPMIDYNHLGQPDRFGGQTVLDLNLLSLTRNEGTDTRRLSIRPGWQLPFIGPLGGAYKISFALNGDLYYVDDLQRDGKTNFSGSSGRLVPLAKLDWRFPLVKSGKNISQVIEPIFSAVYTPYGGNPDDIPNEDSVELEFDDTNLFSANKFSGIDRVEEGPRFNYGLKWGVYGKKGGNSSVFLGQSWRPKSDDTFVTGSGLEENFSDFVGRVQVSPGPYLDINYRTRFASDNLSLKRNEVTFQAGVPAFKVAANYVFIESQENSEFPGREEISYSGSSQLNRFWRVGFSGVTDLVTGEARAVRASLIYENECVILTTRASRTFFRDRDLEPTDQVTFNVVLKTLGEIRTDVF